MKAKQMELTAFGKQVKKRLIDKGIVRALDLATYTTGSTDGQAESCRWMYMDIIPT